MLIGTAGTVMMREQRDEGAGPIAQADGLEYGQLLVMPDAQPILMAAAPVTTRTGSVTRAGSGGEGITVNAPRVPATPEPVTIMPASPLPAQAQPATQATQAALVMSPGSTAAPGTTPAPGAVAGASCPPLAWWLLLAAVFMATLTLEHKP